MKFTNFFQLLATLCYFTHLAAEDPKYAALIFDQKYKRLDEIKNDEDGCHNCLTACPASSQMEKKFDENDSITGDSLFVVESYPSDNKEKKLQIQICDKPFKPVTVWDVGTNSHEIGYELYYKEDQTDYYLKCDKYDHFRKIINGRPNVEPHSHSHNVRKYTDGDNTVFEFEDNLNEKLTFYWIPVLSIRTLTLAVLPPAQLNNRQITFKPDAMTNYKPHETISECKEYNLGDTWQTTSTNKKSKTSGEPPSSSSLPMPPCNQPNECLEMTQIIPMMYFQAVSTRLATCSYLNIANISRNIATGQLKTIDRYLYAMYRIWAANDIQIVFGITGELNFTKGKISSYEPERNLSKDEAYREFPTPEIIYRIVKYKVKGNIYQTVIVIHNNFDATPVRQICSNDEEVSGWHKIKSPDADQNVGLSYACPVTHDTVMQLAIDKTAGISPSKALELNAFPKYNDETGKIEVDDQTELIDEEIKYLIEDLQIVD